MYVIIIRILAVACGFACVNFDFQEFRESHCFLGFKGLVSFPLLVPKFTLIR